MSDISLPVVPAVNAVTPTRDASPDATSASGTPDQHQFASVLNLVKTDDTETSIGAAPQVAVNAKSLLQGQGASSDDKPKLSEDDVTQTASAAELLMMLSGSAPPPPPLPTPTPVLSSDIATNATDLLATDSVAGSSTGAIGASTLVTAMPLQPLAGKVDAMKKNLVNNVSLANAAPQSTVGDAAQASNTSAVPTGLLTSITDRSEATPDKQLLLDLGHSFARLLDRTQDNSQDSNSATVDCGSGTNVNMSATLAAMGSAATTQTVQDTTGMPARHELHTPVGNVGWTEELGNKLVVLSKHDTPIATLHVTPADLGPVQIRIETQNNQANVWFSADHADTRSAIEQSLPKLREMFSAQGLQLNDAGVFGERSGRQTAYNGTQTGSSWLQRAAQPEVADVDTVTVRTLSLSMVDTYA